MAEVIEAQYEESQPVGPVSETALARKELTEREEYFAMRLALGDTMTAASRAVGLSRRHAYRWAERPEIQDAVRKHTATNVDAARRMITGKVKWAARRLYELGKHGGASHKGAVTEMEAIKLILQINRVAEVQIGTTQSRIISRVPRADDGTFLPHTDDDPALAYREDTLPLAPTADGLPPDFRRGTQEQGTQYAQPNPTLPDHLSDPSFYRRSMYDRET